MGTRLLTAVFVAAGMSLVAAPATVNGAPLSPAVTAAGAVNTGLVEEVQSRSRRYDRGNRYNRHYDRHRHGNRYRYKHGRYRHYHGGYWYANPWWVVPGVGIGLGLGAVAPGNSCGYWSQRCAANWGYGGSNYYGCLRYYGC